MKAKSTKVKDAVKAKRAPREPKEPKQAPITSYADWCQHLAKRQDQNAEDMWTRLYGPNVKPGFNGVMWVGDARKLRPL